MRISRTLLIALPALALLAPTSVATASPAAPTSAERAGTVIMYHGAASRATLPLSPDELKGAPHSFRAFAREQLRETWVNFLHHKPACKGAPLMNVTGLRTDGFAVGDFGTYPRPGCQTGGGYEAFWAIRKGEWKQVIGTQDIPTCDRLEKLNFPSDIGVDQCADGRNVITYDHP